MIDKRNFLNLSRVFSSASGDLFNGFFTSGRKWKFDKASLVDNRARRIFDLAKRACEHNVYPYQLPLEGRSGPWVQAEGSRMLMLSPMTTWA